MKTKIKKFVYGATTLALTAPIAALAGPADGGGGWNTNGGGGLDLAHGPATTELDIAALIGNVVDWIFTFLGILAVLMILISGVMYLTAAGDESRAEKAKGILTYAVIGLIISILAVAITRIVVNTLVQ